MNKNICLLIASAGLIISGCNDKKKDDKVISQQYKHKYGYPISEEDWETGRYPGTVTTILRNGVTVVANYEGGMLHGLSTHTYPHSPTIEASYLYENGKLVKENLFDVKGTPLSEFLQLSPTRHAFTLWYQDGSPQCLEEYVGEELLEGQYFTTQNETEARVEKGNGLRVRRDREGVLLSKDHLENGYLIKRESFFSNGSPESLSFYNKNKLHGEQYTYAVNGEPVSIAEWVEGKLHGKCTFFKNGEKYLEVSYLDDQKNGAETHYKQGRIVQQTLWENNKRHGETVFHLDENQKHTEYYYDGKQVSFEKFKELNRIDELITDISPENTVYQ